MSGALRILAAAGLDARGIGSRGASGERTISWEELGTAAPGSGRTYRQFTGQADNTFRRLDRPTRAVVLAAAALRLEQVLSEEEREETGVVVESVAGCLEADLKYTSSLTEEIVHGSIFPYTLQSTCLGDVALRHKLHGPTLSLSVTEGSRGEALREAGRMIQAEHARYVVVGSVDALTDPIAGLEPSLRCVLCLLGSEGAAAPTDLALTEGAESFERVLEAVLG